MSTSCTSRKRCRAATSSARRKSSTTGRSSAAPKGRASKGGRKSPASGTSTSTARTRGRTTASPAPETVYAVCWNDSDGDAGVYKCFRERGRALDYARDVAVDRAVNLEVDILDSEYWKTPMTEEQIRDQLGSNGAIMIPFEFYEFPGGRDPSEWAEVAIYETEVE